MLVAAVLLACMLQLVASDSQTTVPGFTSPPVVTFPLNFTSPSVVNTGTNAPSTNAPTTVVQTTTVVSLVDLAPCTDQFTAAVDGYAADSNERCMALQSYSNCMVSQLLRMLCDYLLVEFLID
jgi:hypothetical protein